MKQFHISDVLTVTTGKFVSTRHMEGVYEILNYMTGDSLFTHQLPRASEECKPYLLQQFPQLVEVTGDEVTIENWKDWLDQQIEKYGMYFDVEPLPEEEHKFIDPISEMIEILSRTPQRK